MSSPNLFPSDLRHQIPLFFQIRIFDEAPWVKYLIAWINIITWKLSIDR